MEQALALHTPGICWQCRDGGHPCDYGDTYGDCYRKGTPQLIDDTVHFYCRAHSRTIPYLLTGAITLELHAVDGFTLYALDASGHLAHRRFIDYSVHDALALFLMEFGGPVSPDNSCPNSLGWVTDYWHECDTCR